MREGGATLFAGLALAIASAASINLGYLLEHVAVRPATPASAGLGTQLLASIRSARWRAGLAPTALGFARQVTAITAGMALAVPDSALKAISVQWSADGTGALTDLGHAVRRGYDVRVHRAAGGAAQARAGQHDLADDRVHDAFASIAAGLICFGESLGRSAPITALHALAIAVLPCVRPLAAAQAQLEDTLAQAAPADARHSRSG